MPKRKEASLPVANPGDGWVVLWKTPELRDTPEHWETREPRIVRRPTLTIASAHRGDFNPLGLGTVMFALSSLPLGSTTASDLSAIAGSSTAVGSAQSINRAWMHETLEDTPERAVCASAALAVERTARALDQAKALPRTTLNAYRGMSDHRWQGMAICPGVTEHYGLAYIPNDCAEHLLAVEGKPFGEAYRELEPSHVLVDLLATKRSLMLALGFLEAVELDKKLVGNALQAKAAA